MRRPSYPPDPWTSSRRHLNIQISHFLRSCHVRLSNIVSQGVTVLVKMADRSSISSFFKSSLRGPFQRPAHQQDSEANGGTYSTHSIPTFQSHLCSPFATTCPNSLSFCTASEEKAPGFSVNIALGQSNADTSKTPYEMRRQQVRRAQK